MLKTKWPLPAFSLRANPETKNGISVPGVAPDSGRTNVKAREAIGVDDFGSRLTPSPLNVAVKAFLSPADMNALLLPLLYQVLTGKPWPGAMQPGELGTSGTMPTTPGKGAMSKPSVQLSVAGLGLSSILQALGIVGTPFGMGQYPTETGTLATLVPIATAAIGATGGFGALANLGLSLLGGFRRPTT
jgi:hypothetical protein